MPRDAAVGRPGEADVVVQESLRHRVVRRRRVDSAVGRDVREQVCVERFTRHRRQHVRCRPVGVRAVRVGVSVRDENPRRAENELREHRVDAPVVRTPGVRVDRDPLLIGCVRVVGLRREDVVGTTVVGRDPGSGARAAGRMHRD